jgi:hypothetical protein
MWALSMILQRHLKNINNFFKNFMSHVGPCGANSSVADPHHFYAAPAPGKNFDAAPAVTKKERNIAKSSWCLLTS